MYTLVVFQGPSGSGKTTLQYHLGLEKVVTVTTRPPREGEVEGTDYHFVSESEMIQLISEGRMLESTKYNGNIYGTMLSTVINIGTNPKSIVLDSCGVQKVRDLLGQNCLTIGVYAPKDDCRRRLIQRSKAECEMRLSTYDEEVNSLLRCDMIINNSDNNSKQAKNIICALRDQIFSN